MNDTMTGENINSPKAQNKADLRAAALRENLKKRKTQAKERREDEKSEDSK